jgi:hypothetical protein
MARANAGTPLRDWLLVYAVLGGPVAWAVHLTLLYPLVHVACAWGSEMVLHAITISTSLVAAGTVAVGWRYLRHPPAEVPEVVGRRVRTMSYIGMVLGLLFLFVIWIEAIPSFIGDPCLLPGQIMEEPHIGRAYPLETALAARPA